MRITKLSEFILYVENTLGWAPPENQERWVSYGIEARKLKRKMATNPDLYTLDNLVLAVALLRHERKPVRSPVAVCSHVERAIKLAAAPETTSDLAGKIHQAIIEAFTAGDTTWVERLAAAHGTARRETLNAWREHQKANA
jgi:hypothetical protein